MRHRRRQFVIGVLAAGAAVSTTGLIASRLVKSPRQAAADAAPPPPSVLSAAVELRVLKDTVVIRGVVGAGGSFDVTPVPAAGASPVVTRTHVKAGDEVRQAVSLLEVAGRPLFALQGSLPVYRDLRPADTGQDVSQLQRALADLGYRPGEEDGVFGPGTKLAVTKLYRDLGYEPVISGDARALEAADHQVTTAERAHEAAKERLARLQAMPPTPAPGEPDPIATAQREVAFAREDLTRAKKTFTRLSSAYGASLPASEVVFLPSFPARVDAITAVVGKPVQAPLITLSSGSLVVRAKLNPGQGELLRPGMPVDVQSELLGTSAKGVIESIGGVVQDQQAGRHFPVLITATGTPFDPKLAGADVRLTIEAASTNGPVLVVPLSAIHTGSDGRTAVQLLGSDGKVTRVEVNLGASGDGHVMISPVGGAITEGDRVVVGGAQTGAGA